MATIYLAGQRINNDRDYKLFKELSYRLLERGHEIFQDDVELGKDIELSFRRALNVQHPGHSCPGFLFLFILNTDNVYIS
ncbi:MAG: hypothetical protein QM668_13195 [Agriterribacter sp.]